MIIDAHVHYTPPDLRDRLPQMSEPYWELLLNSPQSIQGWVSAEKMLNDMDAAGVDKVILVGEYFRQHANCVARNNAVLNLIDRYPDRIGAFAIASPNAGPQAVKEVERCLDAGMIGVGELNFYAQGFTPRTPAFRDICRLCTERNAPINLHGSEPVGGYYLGKSTTPLHVYYQLAVDFPALKLIYAHWGGGLLFYEIMPRTRRALANVYYDTAASPLLYPTRRIFQMASACVEPHKILYGSDYPLKIYPRRMEEPNFGLFLDAIRKHVPDGKERRLVLGENFSALLMRREEGAGVELEGGEKIVGEMGVGMVAAVWPETGEVFGRFHIPIQTPAWEPITQAAAAAGHDAAAQNELLHALNELISKDES